jgi:hypothetical protein
MLDGGVGLRQGSCVGGRQNDFRIWALSLDLQTDSLTFILSTHTNWRISSQFDLATSIGVFAYAPFLSRPLVMSQQSRIHGK